MPEELSNEVKGAVYDLANRCWDIAEKHGWHEPVEIDGVIPGRFNGEKVKVLVKRTPGEHLALWHSEISETLEEYRTGQPLDRVYQGASSKPEGVPVEAADLLIRMLDTLKEWGAIEKFIKALEDKMNFNEIRPYRHGGKAL
jgi:hypothetical protein